MSDSGDDPGADRWLSFDVRFRVLGPLEVWDGDRQVPLGGPQQHAVLAVLLVHAGQVVSVDRLADQLWGGDPPPTARSLIQGCVAGLRRALRTGTVELVTQSPGYVLRPSGGAVDAVRFEELAAVAAAAVSPARSAALFREALELWRGPAFDGLDAEACRAESARLAERRMTVLEQRIDADLTCGRAAELVGELRVVTAEHPLRERLWAQLMTALHRSDQRAAALDTYREVRRRLVDGLGVEPGPTLRELHRAILSEAGGDSPDPAPRPDGPAQLPSAVSAFSGRAGELDRLDDLLGRPGRAVPIWVVCGTAGVGKTALAVHWAHRARARFPDGQLYVNLRGYATAAPLRPIEALAGFLSALGVPADQVPSDTERAAAMYRTLLADRRVLVILDNARTAEQVRPLLPGGSACAALITSRDRLGGLVAQDGADHLTLGMLTASEAASLLERVLGARARAEGDAVAELARRCAYLPLALRIAAAHLMLHPGRTVAGYLDRLGAAGGLDELAAGDDATVRIAFDLSYQGLDEPARLLFRRLGLAPGADVTVDDAATLGDLDPYVAGRLLDRLTGAHLIEESRPGRYAFHDLLRQYAAEHNPPADRDTALTRLYGRYVDLARSAAALLYPHMLLLPHPEPESGHAHAAAALTWLESERANLVQAVEAAAQRGPRRPGWILADALRGAFHLSRHTTGWLTMAEAALSAATADGDRAAQAAARQSLGTAQRSIGAYPDALHHYTEALRLARECGWAESEATNLGNLGIVCRKMGRLSEAADHLHAALTVDRRIGRRSGEANNLGNLADVYHAMGRLPEAAAAYRAALNRNAEAGIVHGEALARTGLGQVGIELGRPDEAREHLDRALDLYRRVGDRDGESVVRSVLATVECALGRPGAAREQATAALAGAREVGDPQSEAMALNALGRADRLLGDAKRAIAHHDAAYRVAHRTADRREEAEALIGLSDAHRRAGRPGDAAGYALRAHALAQRGGLGLVTDRAAAALAVIHAGADSA